MKLNTFHREMKISFAPFEVAKTSLFLLSSAYLLRTRPHVKAKPAVILSEHRHEKWGLRLPRCPVCNDDLKCRGHHDRF
jgi:hypothetical protein